MRNKFTKHKIFLLIVCLLFSVGTQLFASEKSPEAEKEFSPAEVIFDHIGDSYQWHITVIMGHHLSIPLPIIVYTKEKGLNVFSSSHFHGEHASYNGFSIAKEGTYKGKVITTDATGAEIRPWDFSITKNAFAILFNSLLLIFVILYVAKWYKKKPLEAPKGLRGGIEMLVMSLQNDIIKPSVGAKYKKFSPYLLTIFFFIFTNNLMGLIPLFPGGANTTGNIAITMVLAFITFLVVNIFATKEYWKEIILPDVPLWLRSPIFPLMPVIEVFGIIIKPFALMIRLFANILAGHAAILTFTCIIFIVAKLGPGISVSMTLVSVFFSIFMNLLEILVAFIQAYVFLMLSAVFIGLSNVEAHKQH